MRIATFNVENRSAAARGRRPVTLRASQERRDNSMFSRDAIEFYVGYFSTLWEPFDEIKETARDKRSLLQASGHHCLWADLKF